MDIIIDRRQFIKKNAGAIWSAAFLSKSGVGQDLLGTPDGKRIGIIGLDTSHSSIFAKAFNTQQIDSGLGGFKVVAACSKGSPDIASALSNVGPVTEEIRTLGIPIVDSIEELLEMTDAILLETNDGRMHLEQALPVLKAGKKLFIDKPIAASLSDAVKIFEASEKYNVPVFSSSALRFMSSAQKIARGAVGRVLGADTFSPATVEQTHPDLYWYGIHGIEILFAVMGTGCVELSRTHTPDTDVVVGVWDDNRIGTFRGIRNGGKGRGFGGTVFGNEGIATVGPFDGYENLLREIVKFFQTGIVPVTPAETLEICAFIEAADISKRKGGAFVKLSSSTR